MLVSVLNGHGCVIYFYRVLYSIGKGSEFCFVSRSIFKMFVRLYVILLGLGWEVLVGTVLIYLKDKIYFEALWLFLNLIIGFVWWC